MRIYGGANFAQNSDVTIVRPGGTNLTLSNLPWEFRNTMQAPYVGARMIYWFNSMPYWGLGVEGTHAVAYSKRDGTFGTGGTLLGATVPGSQTLNTVISHFEFTDGLNMITANAYYRFSPAAPWTPYLGAGVGVVIPRVELSMTGYPFTDHFEITGIAARGIAGASYKLFGGLSAFGEYQLSYSRVDNATLTGGGTVNTSLVNHHLNLGLSYSFR